MKLSIVFSFRNEEDVLETLVERLQKALQSVNLQYELIFVNDASDDRSYKVLMQTRERNPNVKIINMSRKFGVAPCLIAGLRDASGDVVIYMDADLQDPPEVIPCLIQKWQEGFDVVHTTRTRRRGESGLKLCLTKIAYRMINMSSNIDIPMDTGDFKLLSRRAVDHMIRFSEHDPFMRGLARWVGFKQAYVFYEREERFAGKSHFPVFGSFNPLKEFVNGIISFSELPLWFILIAGFFAIAGSCFYFLGGIIIRFVDGFVPVWYPPLGGILLMGGIVLFALGILGVYLGQIHKDIKNRPMYIIESKVGVNEDDRKN